jgi:YHS domain-containing protein
MTITKDPVYYFCSAGCKATFEKDPTKYAKA